MESNDPPYLPSDPSPEDGLTSINIDVDLGWSGGDPNPGDSVVYDVYFEANNPNPDVKVADNIDKTDFDPGTLEYGTVYYWKIVAQDNHYRVTYGPVWQFTTEENIPPNKPDIDGPIKGNVGIPVTYKFLAIDSDGDKIYYYIDWDDGNIEEWIGPWDSGLDITVSHTWASGGTYTIKAQCKDTKDGIGDWGDLTVTMSKDISLKTQLLQFFQNHQNLLPILRNLIWLLGL